MIVPKEQHEPPIPNGVMRPNYDELFEVYILEVYIDGKWVYLKDIGGVCFKAHWHGND